MNKLLPLIAFSVLLLVPAWAPSVFAEPGNTEIEFFGGPTGPQDRFGFGITDPDGIDELITIQGTSFLECRTSTVLSITDIGLSVSLPSTITIVDCEPDGDTTTWTLTNTGVTCISGSCLPPRIASCGLDPEDVIVILAPNELSQVILKKIDCNAGILSVDIDAKDCENSGIDISFDNIFINPSLDWRGDETITNDDNAVSGDVICSISFGVTSELGTVELPQIITITTPEPTVVGGELLPIDTTALLLAGAQMNAAWMIPLIVAGIVIGVFVIKRRK